MQTFLPYPDMIESARVLDPRRLGKQRVECYQILRALHEETRGWVNHPAVRMWRGNTNYLVCYGVAMCDEWVERGFRDSCREKIMAYFRQEPTYTPHWVGDAWFHLAHRSNLLRKTTEAAAEYERRICLGVATKRDRAEFDYNAEHRDRYAEEFGLIPLDIPYVWPNPEPADMIGA